MESEAAQLSKGKEKVRFFNESITLRCPFMLELERTNIFEYFGK